MNAIRPICPYTFDHTDTGLPVTLSTCWAMSTDQASVSPMRSTTALASVTRATEPTAGGSVGSPWTRLASWSSAGASTRSAAASTRSR